MTVQSTRRTASRRNSVFSLSEPVRFKATDEWSITSLPVGHFIESIYDLIDISIEGYEGLDDVLVDSDEALIVESGQVFDVASNKVLVKIVIMDSKGNTYTIKVDKNEHRDARLVVSRQSYESIRADQ